MSDFEKAHQCEKSKGKIVAIQKDLLGNTYCGYCGQRVCYSEILNKMEEYNEERPNYKTTKKRTRR